MSQERAVIEIYEPPVCCPGGKCKPEMDQALVEVFETLNRLSREHGERVAVRRFITPPNLRMVRNDAGLRDRLAGWQQAGLFPVTCVDGKVVKTQGYPSYEELLTLAGLAPAAKA